MNTPNWQQLWQKQCRIWLDSIRRNGQERSVGYDFAQHRLTLVPRTCWLLHSNQLDHMHRELDPIMKELQKAGIESECRLDVTYIAADLRDPSNRWDMRVDRVHIYLDGAEAITHLAMTVDADMLILEGGLGRK